MIQKIISIIKLIIKLFKKEVIDTMIHSTLEKPETGRKLFNEPYFGQIKLKANNLFFGQNVKYIQSIVCKKHFNKTGEIKYIYQPHYHKK